MGEKENQVLLDEARGEYDHLLNIIKNNSNRVSSLISFLPVFIGIIISSTVYVYTNLDKIGSEKLFIEPITISIGLLIISFLLGLIGILPVKRSIFIMPSELYRIKNSSKENILDMLLQNYIHGMNNIYRKFELRPFISILIVIFTIIAMVEYTFFGIYHFSKNDTINIYIPIYIGIAIIIGIVISFIIDYIKIKKLV